MRYTGVQVTVDPDGRIKYPEDYMTEGTPPAPEPPQHRGAERVASVAYWLTHPREFLFGTDGAM